MTPEEWNKAKELFDAALVREPSQWPGFLAENCPDSGVRQQVETLLVNFQEAGSFLSHSALHPNVFISEDPWSTSPTRTIPGADDPMIGRHLGCYKLERRIGQGGMAAVFLAVRADGEFRREVALKLILPGSERNETLSRFRKERQTLAGLDHPNIVKLLDGGSTPEGLPYLVMDYVEGSPIDQYCDRHKLSVEQRLRLFGKVCEAVEHAHQKQVIHRDLKPANILVTAEGVPKLLDFGIAKVLEPIAGLPALTQTGARCMTPAYASPEQVHGKSVTAATDIYSLGAVLYELLTGHRPYRLKEQTPAEIERAICEQEPENPSTAVNRVERETLSDGTTVTRTPVTVSQTREGHPDRLRRRLRGDLDTIVLKALQKEPERRYSSVEELGRDIDRHLRRLPVQARRSTLIYRASRLLARHRTVASTGALLVLVMAGGAWLTFQALGLRYRTREDPSMRIRALAVLPLADLSAGRTQEYFSDGMTDALITDLAQIASLRVISRTSSMQYKQTRMSLPEIARELNVDGIVEGSIQRSGDRVRITAQLIHGPSDRHLWANTYEGDFRDVFTLERNVTQDIARQVQARLMSNQSQQTQPRPTNPKALDAYLQGNYHLQRYGQGGGVEEMKKASDLFQQAIDADPKFAPAYFGLAHAHAALPLVSPEDSAIARKAEETGLALDPNSPEGQTFLANDKLRELDWSGAEKEFRRALAINPNNAAVHNDFCGLLGAMGRLDDALKECQIAQGLDPDNDHLAMILYTRGDYKHAISILRLMTERHSDDGGLHYALFECYVKTKNDEDAVAELERTLTLYGLSDAAARIHNVFPASGFRAAMLQWAKEIESLQAKNQFYMPVNLADAYAVLGDKDRAFYWLSQAIAHRDAIAAGEPATSLGADPMLESLRGDPRFKDLMHRIGLLS